MTMTTSTPPAADYTHASERFRVMLVGNKLLAQVNRGGTWRTLSVVPS